ncbi:ABC transporter permease [Georgenia wangjunii]|uniref:ABC transporter permease n=1 Tax=Georgenia wangjunii TaxID=3117730 RepID=UPI002F269803
MSTHRREAGTAAGAALPPWVYALAGLALLVVGVPVLGLLTEVPWRELPALVTSPSALAALSLSVRTAAAATALCVVLGVPLALVLARARLPGLRVVRAVVMLPLVLPPVVAGIALLATLGRRGLLGGQLDAWGISIAFSTAAVVLAQTFVSLPFLVVSLEGGLRAAGHAYEDVAATLGARPTTVLRRVTLPLVAPALTSGMALAFARSLGEFGATLTFAGSLEGVTRTLPLEIYLRRETEPDVAVALSVVLVAVAAAIVLATRLGRREAGA